MQRFLVGFLFVEGPPQLVESELVIRRGGAPLDDRRIGVVRVAVASAGEEILCPSELHFLVVFGIRVRLDQAVHRFEGLVGEAEFIVSARFLIENFVSVLVIRILREQPVIESNRFDWTVGAVKAAWIRAGAFIGAYPELFLDLKIRKTPHRVRSQVVPRCFRKEKTVSLNGLVETVFYPDLLRVQAHVLNVRSQVAQFRQRSRGPGSVRRATSGDEGRCKENWNACAAHYFPSCAARS